MVGATACRTRHAIVRKLWDDRAVRGLALFTMVGLLIVVGCGDESEEGARESSPAAATTQQPTPTATRTSTPNRKRRPAAGTTITLRDSQFGTMLWGPRRQAVYIFERDRPDRSRCYGACAEAWPPVFTKGAPVAGRGVRASLLGTTRRRDGRRQVTYAGKQLYYYAHEGPGQVLCHNVDLNGGLWWVVGPNGKRRP
jgi:predicted lipoprotein with Yx(FWY)xxD motif